jgi:hypothetical protein
LDENLGENFGENLDKNLDKKLDENLVENLDESLDEDLECKASKSGTGMTTLHARASAAWRAVIEARPSPRYAGPFGGREAINQLRIAQDFLAGGVL